MSVRTMAIHEVVHRQADRINCVKLINSDHICRHFIITLLVPLYSGFQAYWPLISSGIPFLIVLTVFSAISNSSIIILLKQITNKDCHSTKPLIMKYEILTVTLTGKTDPISLTFIQDWK